jgi:transposase
MDTNTLFTMALGLQPPWEVKHLQFDEEAKRLDITIDFTRGADFPCPVCGQPAKVHDTEEKTWRHLDFFQHAAYLTARVPRCKCDVDGVKQVQVPWARPGSGFTILFEALIMTLVQAMPVASVAKLVGEHDTKLWRLLHHNVDEARTKVGMSGVTRVGIDETAAKRGHTHGALPHDQARDRGDAPFRVRRTDVARIYRGLLQGSERGCCPLPLPCQPCTGCWRWNGGFLWSWPLPFRANGQAQ